MPSSLAEALAERLLHRLPPDRAYDRAALEAAATEEAALPHTVRHFLDRMMTRRVEIEREHLRVLRQPWLDHEHDEVRRAEDALLAAVHQHVRIPAAAWERVLRHASGRVAAYLVRPVPALEDFVFGTDAPSLPSEAANGEDKQDALPADVVMRRLSYFTAYPYLREATSAYVEQRDVPAFPRRRLTALLRRVDERMCADYDADDWLRLLQPLFALARAADREGLPFEMLETFFEEKKADLPLQRLRAARREHEDLGALSPTTLRKIIAPPAPSEARDARETPESPTSQTEATAPPPKAAPASDAAKANASATPLPERDTPPERGKREANDANRDEPRSAAASAGQAPPDAAAPPPPRPETSSEGSSSEEPSGSEPSDESSSDAVPLWKRFLGVDAPEKPDAPAQPPPRPAPSGEAGGDTAGGEETAGDSARPRWQQFSVVSAGASEQNTSKQNASEQDEADQNEATRPAPTPPDASPQAPGEPPEATEGAALRSLEEAVLGHAADNRALFVRELFGGSRAEYERVLRRLQGADDWRTATQIIARDVFRAHQVNIYSDPARSFTDAAEARFR